MIEKRHTCIICKRKRYEHNMKKVLINSWACIDKYYFQYCIDNKEIIETQKFINLLKTFKFIKKTHLL